VLPAGPAREKAAKDDTTVWLGAKIKSMQTEGEKSATGMFDVTGVLFIDVPAGSEAEKLGFRTLDVVLGADGGKVGNLKAFLGALAKAKPGAKVAVSVRRGRGEQLITCPAGSGK
ncbi:MAG TPA: PDZ domain-containing protein, partial [Phycisphaerae bacterium]|nr:PDZ domain-containing protein [Phycisphaerae bacterium]